MLLINKWDKSPSSHQSIISTIVGSKIEDKLTNSKLSDFKFGVQNSFISSFRMNRDIRIRYIQSM